MGKINANKFLLKYETTDGSGVYTDIAHISTNNVPMTSPAIDANNKTDGPVQCLIRGGIQAWDTAFDGIANDTASLQKIIDIHLGNGIDGNSWRFRTEWQDNQGVLIGTFACILYLEGLEFGGGIGEVLAFSGSMRSSGALSYTEAP